MTKTIDDNNVKHLSFSILKNKFLNTIWMLGQNNARLTLYLGVESKYPQILTLYGLMDFGLTTRINRVFLECFLKSEG